MSPFLPKPYCRPHTPILHQTACRQSRGDPIHSILLMTHSCANLKNSIDAHHVCNSFAILTAVRETVLYLNMEPWCRHQPSWTTVTKRNSTVVAAVQPKESSTKTVSGQNITELKKFSRKCHNLHKIINIAHLWTYNIYLQGIVDLGFSYSLSMYIFSCALCNA